jgi:TolB-like protein/Tfp pilus assembly protein PilF
MSFFVELKRRNVFRVGIAYVLMGWLLLQGADFAFDLVGAPNWVIQSLSIVVVIGLPITLFFAWAFEVTPEGIKRDKDVDRSQSITGQTGKKLNVAILVLLVASLGYFVWESRFAGQPAEQGTQAVATTTSPEQTPEEATPQIDPKSIAVLPFNNRSRQEADEPFVEGVHDDLLTNLARIGSLKVISRTSVLQYKDTETPIPVIADELGVATVLEGAVQRSGNQVRINVQLIDAQSNDHLWAEIFDRELTAENLFAIQSEISQKIANALETTLTQTEKDRINTMPTDNLEAFEAYVRGRQLMASRESAQLEQAVEELNRAVELDPEFALAWVGVADSHMLWWQYGTFDPKQGMTISEAAIDRALMLDDQLGEAYASKGTNHFTKREFDQAVTDLQKAIELSPNYATAYHWYSLVLREFPLRAQERVDFARRAFELDPNSEIVGRNLADTYRDQGLYSRAEQRYLAIIENDPGFATAYGGLSNLYQNEGRFDLAMEQSRNASLRDPGNPDFLVDQAFIYLQLGEPEKAEELRQKIEDLEPESIGGGYVDIFTNLVRGNIPGMREAMNWTLPRLQKVNASSDTLGLIEAMHGEPQKSRELFLLSDPGWMNPESWQGLIEQSGNSGCLFAWLLMQTGDVGLGDQLLQQTTIYLTEDLPAVIEHADQLGPEMCHLVAGDTEKAYAALETSLDHNHLGFWREFSALPMYELVRHEQRFQDLLTEHDRRIEEQREAVALLDEGTAL